MSTGLSTVQIIDFDAQVKAAYQNAGMLRRFVRYKTGVIGYQTKFRKYSRGVASPRIPQTDVVPMGTTHGEVTATLADWHAADYVDGQDQDKTNVQEMPIITTNIGAAIGRREDQIIIDALAAAKGSADIAHGSAGLTYAKLTQINKLFAKASVPRGKRNLLIEAEGEEDLINEAKFTSLDYISKAVIESGQLPPTLLGMNIIVMDAARDEGGLPLASTTQTCFAWDSDALGLAIGGMDTPVKIERVAEKNSNLAAQYFSGGAVAIDTAGIFEIEYTV